MVFYPVFVVAIVPLEYRTLLFSLSLFHSGIIFVFAYPRIFSYPFGELQSQRIEDCRFDGKQNE